MAYFLPSYLQKRLLRYALTRLDLIETDDLDLENLGLTFGQRSVVELKNVSIKVNKLAERANLPPSVLINHATIRLLRLTVPADLHASGILVEVEGINVQVRLVPEEQEQNIKTSPDYSDKANRTRISSPPLHDPGGSRRHNHRAQHIEVSRVLPTSRDLAASFLESEPVQEKQELEAALGSQSRLYESTTSSGFSDEGELGMAGGLTLPTFVANFFQGVADRLSVSIKEVAITVQLALSVDDSDNITFTVKIGAVDVNPAALAASELDNTDTFRKITVHDVKFGLEAEPDTLSQTSSPRLERGSFRGSPFVSQDGTKSSSPNNSSPSNSGVRRESPDLNASFTEFQTSGHFVQERSASESDPSSFFQTGLGSGLRSSDSDPMAASEDVDNKANAQMYASAGPPSPESERTSASSNGNNILSESKFFSHEEAASMYMSAMSSGDMASTTRPMPGAWDSSEPPSHQKLPQADAGEPLAADTPSEERSSTPPHAHVPDEESTAGLVNRTTEPEEKITSPTVFIQILKLDTISLCLPTDMQMSRDQTQAGSSNRTTRRPISMGRPGASLAYSTLDQHYDEIPVQNKGVDIDVGTLTVDVDLRICKQMVRVTQGLMKRFQPNSTSTTTQDSAVSSSMFPDVNLKLASLVVNFREASNIVSDRNLFSQSGPMPNTDGPLLCLSLSDLRYIQRGSHKKTLTISRIALRHNSKDVLFFVDNVNVRDSIAGSSMLRPHDLSIAISDGRVEVQVKAVHATLDLVAVDDVLSRSGGLSSLIDLGNSIASTSTVTRLARAKTHAPQQRIVRFDDPHQRTRSQSDPPIIGSKINVRVSGCILDLVGSEASVQIKSSAVKLAWRGGQARVIIDGAVIEGPLLPKSRSPPGILIRLKSVDIRYLDVPEETDLDRLLSLITPSHDRYDNDDDIMVDTLLRQRRKGGVLRLVIGDTSIHARGLDWQVNLVQLSEELSKLSSVTKYLPEDDRPGVLTFALINKFDLQLDLDRAFGPLNLQAELIEGAHINVPSLAAAQVSSWSLARSKDDVLIGEVLPQNDAVMGPPMLMCRFVADEMEPTVRLKLSNTCVEYKVSTIIAMTDLSQRLAEGQTSSHPKDSLSRQSSPSASSASEDSSNFTRKIRISVNFRDSAIALHPTGSSAKGLFVLTSATIGYDGHKRGSNVNLELKKATLLIINNTEVLGAGVNNADQKMYFDQNDQIQQLAKYGFVPVGSMSSASAIIKISQDEPTRDQHLDIEFRNNLLFLETCADSTQTLILILNGLSPPTPPSSKAKYRTEVIPIQDMLASFTGNAFVTEPGPHVGLQASQATATTFDHDQDRDDDEYDDGGFMNDLYDEDDGPEDDMTASYVESEVERSETSSSHRACRN